MIQKLLIANRGEIAVRIIRTCREMGIRTVAVYSEADADALHVRFADHAVAIGESEPTKSYLNIEAIVGAAIASGADAIHPGYGFLSERPEFAEACEASKIVFVGPPPAAMRALGDKISAKTLAVKGGVPIVPGYFEQGAGAKELAQAAEQVGYPVMLKAAAGGGGRGMRVVRNPDEFEEAFATASDEARKAFGNDAMMLEKLIDRPRHIEVQILADLYGNVECLFERECSTQRRHQKLIEETPSPFFAARPQIWPAMRESAVKVARLAQYRNAGTVEFIVDGSTGEFFFLEVNARLQVEHPVTEAITGLDLVRWQLLIAQGESIEGLRPKCNASRDGICGHAIEARIIAEDPARGFLPSAGRIVAWAEPRSPGIRVDGGFAQDSEVPRFYDSLLAKVIAHGSNRSEAIVKLSTALLDFHILGVHTNIAYLLDVLSHPDFVAGDLDTAFLSRHFADWQPGPVPEEMGALSELASEPAASAVTPRGEPRPAWTLADSFRNVRT